MIRALWDKYSKIQFYRYVFVAGWTTLLDWFIFFVLISLIYYQFALVVSYSIAAVFSYIFHRRFTFKNNAKKVELQFIAHFTIGLVFLFLSATLLYAFVELVELPKMLSRIAVTFTLFILLYLVQRKFTFNQKFIS
jgi:putative flippase GtrA